MARDSLPSKHQIGEYFRRLLIEVGKVSPERIVNDSCVDAELRMESVVFIEIQVALEEAFDIEIDPVQLLELNEFDAIVEYLHACAMSR